MDTHDTTELKETLSRARTEVQKVIIGQDHVINQALMVILAGQHALIEGVPGIGKTLMVKTLGQVLGCPTGRIQFTPDLMPADIIGTNVFNFQKNEFNLVPGAIFTSFLLADEINRAPAKTQSALLQAMQEHVVTIDRQTYSLPEHFTVFATQNPIEFEGTYPLPEAQKDRFMIKINMTFPGLDEELSLARRMTGHDSPEKVLEGGGVSAVLDAGGLTRMRGLLDGILVREEVLAYLVEVVRATRTHAAILVGAGPRATQSLMLAVRILAVLEGRDFVIPDDVKNLALPVLDHRLILRPEFEIEGLTVGEVIQQVLQSVPVPR